MATKKITKRRAPQLTYIIERAKEPSTWRGIIVFLTGVGVAVDPALAEQIIAVGLALAGLVGFLTKDTQS